MALVEIDDVSKTYSSDKIALNGVSIDINRSEFVVIAGPNGAGKTTLMKLIYGELSPDRGKIRLNVPVGKIGVMPQEFTLFEELTSEEHISYLTQLKGIPKQRSLEITRGIIKKLGLEQEKDRIVRYLSGGQKKLVCFGQALAGDNEILILDEPTAGIDVENRNALHTYLDELRKLGTTILYTTHFLDEIESWASRLVMLNKGSSIYDGSPNSMVESLYHSKVEIPHTVRTLNFVKNTGLIYTVSDSEIIIFIRKSEISRIREIIDCGIPEVQEGLKITRPTLEEGYLSFLKKIKK